MRVDHIDDLFGRFRMHRFLHTLLLASILFTGFFVIQIHPVRADSQNENIKDSDFRPLLIGAGQFSHVNYNGRDDMFHLAPEIIDTDEDLYLPIWRIVEREENRILNAMADPTDRSYGDSYAEEDPFDFAYREYMELRGHPSPDIQTGLEYYNNHQYSMALDHFRTGIGIILNTGGDPPFPLSDLYRWSADCFYYRQDYLTAMDTYWKSLELYREDEKPDHVARLYIRVGDIFYFWGDLNRAMAAYNRGLDICRIHGYQDVRAECLLSSAVIYGEWGLTSLALDVLTDAYRIAENLSGQNLLARIYGAIGDIHLKEKNADRALEIYRQAWEIAEKINSDDIRMVLLHSIGRAFLETGEFERAEKCFNDAAWFSGYLGNSLTSRLISIDLGRLYQVQGDLDRALQAYERASFYRQINTYEAAVYDGIADILIEMGEYKRADFYLENAARIKEKLRMTASGTARRDYLESQFHTYEELISNALRLQKPAQAFDRAEEASAKYLTEQISGLISGSPFPGVHEKAAEIGPEAFVVCYENIGRPKFVLLGTERGHVYAAEISKDSFIREAGRKLPLAITPAPHDVRGLSSTPDPVNDDDDFEKIIRYFRYLLGRTSPTPEENAALRYLGSRLYNLLLSPLEEHIEDKDELVIIPDGILAYIPFEALVLPDGRYVIEKYHIQYTPSLTVSHLIAGRSKERTDKSFLGIGGAVYEGTAEEENIDNPPRKADPFPEAGNRSMMEGTLAAIERGEGLRSVYSSLGMSSWQNLPCTLDEVKIIAETIPGSTILTGGEASEALIKDLSASGELSRYRVLHFATHGMVVTEPPELSALVLTQNKTEQEDGYLNVREITELDIQAEFVNLSACETGLGRIYGGEGVVGLMQAFLIAGADGLSVSLWQVADESTKDFMIGLYQIVEGSNLDFARALTVMKRRFITDGCHPFYWAPFVYYGGR